MIIDSKYEIDKVSDEMFSKANISAQNDISKVTSKKGDRYEEIESVKSRNSNASSKVD